MSIFDVCFSTARLGLLCLLVTASLLASGCSDDDPVLGPGNADNPPPALPSPTAQAFRFIDASLTGQGRRLQDDESVNVPLGFTFAIGGGQFSSVNVNSNGYLSFTNPAVNFLNVPLPALSAPENMLAVLWSDWAPPAAGNWVFTQSSGNAPNRQFVVLWQGAQAALAPGKGATFEVILNESGSVEYQYLDTLVNDAAFDNGQNATIGFQDSTRTRGGTFLQAGKPNPVRNNTGLVYRPGF